MTFALAGALFTPASAEILTYRYDALGRLIQSVSQKTGFRTDYSYDAADNRTQVVAQNVGLNLNAGQSIHSGDGRFQLSMQTDGNLVLYGPGGALWSSQTAGSGATLAAFQADGNLVVYTPAMQPLWASNTSGNPGSLLRLQDDGNLVIYDGAMQPTWATNTCCH